MCLTWCHLPREGIQEEGEEICQERINNAFDLGRLVYEVAARHVGFHKVSRRL